MLKVLILGCNGYVGSRFQVEYEKKYKFGLVDICLHNQPLFGNVLQQDFNSLSNYYIQNFDVVLLLAGHSSVPMCKGNFLDSYKNNVENFIGLVSKLNKNQKFIYASSSSVYGVVDSPVDEDYLCFKTYENYDTQKIIIDLISNQMNLNYYGLRFGTVNGYSPYTREDIMLNAMTKSAWENKEVRIFNPTTKRPILAIGDLVRAIDTVIESKENLPGIYNLASFNSNVFELGQAVSEFFDVKLSNLGDNGNKTYDFAIDSSKFINNFNFTFKYDVKKILEELNYYKNDLKWTKLKV